MFSRQDTDGLIAAALQASKVNDQEEPLRVRVRDNDPQMCIRAVFVRVEKRLPRSEDHFKPLNFEMHAGPRLLALNGTLVHQLGLVGPKPQRSLSV